MKFSFCKHLQIKPFLIPLFSAWFALALAQTSNVEDLKQLSIIESSLDASVNPCENFYDYACGNWPSLQVGDTGKDLEDLVRYQHMLNYNELLAREYPLKEQTRKHHQNFTEKAVAYFYSCYAESTKFQILKYLDELKPAAGLEWPLVEVMKAQQRRERYVPPRPWPRGQFDLFALLAVLNSYGFSNELIHLQWIMANERPTISLKVPEVKDINAEQVQEILAQMQLPKQVTRKYYNEVLKVHADFQMFYKNYTQNEDSDRTQYMIPYRGLQHDIPQLYRFLDKIIPQRLRNPDDLVAVSDVDYFHLLLTARNRNPYEIQKICNYLMVKFLIYLKYEQSSNCFYTVKNRMHFALDYLFYKHLYQPQAEERNSHISILTKKIYRQFFLLINENRLDMTAAQLQLVKERLHNITSNIGNLPENVNPSMVEQFYSNLPDMDLENFYGNDLKALKHQMLEKLTCPAKVLCNSQFPALPSNEKISNAVVIPFASLVTPIYHLDLDPLLSLSTFGYLLAHAYAHTIDGGSLNGSSPLFGDIFKHPSVRCLQQLEPTNYIDERLADLVGARVAFQTYSKEYKYNLQPSFSSKPWKKLFFLNLAQVFCAKEPRAPADGGHDSPMTRLNQIVMNLEDFGDAFQCPMGSKMNPARKCRFF